jgi:hypothetical protein
MSKVKAKVDVMYSIRITQELEALIVQVAEKEGRTKTNVIRHYLELGLRVAGKTEQVSFRPAVYDPEHYPELDSVLQNIGGIPA